MPTQEHAQQLFDAMIADGQGLMNIEARCIEVEIQAVQQLAKGTITAEKRDEYLALAGAIRRLATKKFSAQTLFPRR